MAELTRRQEQVMRLVAQGFSNEEIAKRLCVTGHTVEQHLRHLLEKAGSDVDNRVRLVLWWLDLPYKPPDKIMDTRQLRLWNE